MVYGCDVMLTETSACFRVALNLIVDHFTSFEWNQENLILVEVWKALGSAPLLGSSVKENLRGVGRSFLVFTLESAFCVVFLSSTLGIVEIVP